MSVDVLIKLLMVYPFIVCAHSVCPKQNHTVTPRFTTELNAADWVRYGHYINLECCAEGYDHIKWYKLNNVTGVWESFPPPDSQSDVAPELREHGQVVEFKSADLTDEALYQCNVSRDGNVVLTHMVRLYVIECDISSEGPKITEPAPVNQTIDEYNGNVTLYCTGYFGCRDSAGDARLALWSVLGIAQNIMSISPRYHVEQSVREQGAILQATLTITSVQEIDTQRTFLCTVTSDQEVRGQTIVPVHITKRDVHPGIPLIEVILIAGGCALGVILIIIIIMCIRCLWGPQVRLFINRCVPKFGPRYIDDDNILWNLYIFHADEDESIATEWKNVLEKLGYKVRITADMKSGQSRMNDFKEATTKSALVVFLYSENLLQEEMANMFLDIIVMERNGKDIMFLEKTDFKPKQIRDLAREAKLLNRDVIEDNSIIVSIEEDSQNEDDDAKNVAKKIDDLKFWKIIPRLKVPKEGAGKRVKNNFLCSLRNTIPRFRELDQDEVCKKVIKDRAGSGKPLLSDDPPESPVSPAGCFNQSLELSPNMSPNKVNAFDYDTTSVMKVVEVGNMNKSNGTHAHREFEDLENDNALRNPHGGPYPAKAPNQKIEDMNNLFEHEAEVNHPANYNNESTYGIHVVDNVNAVSEPISTELRHSKEAIFTMSGEEETVPKMSPSENRYEVSSNGDNSTSFNNSSKGDEFTPFEDSTKGINFTHLVEESSKGDNQTSINDEFSSQNTSSVQSSSGFGSGSSQASSPGNMDDQCVLPTSRYPGSTYIVTTGVTGTTGAVNAILDEHGGNPIGVPLTGKDGKNLKVSIDKNGQGRGTNKGTVSGSSPESGYVSTEQFNSEGAFLPQIKEAVG